MGIVLIHAHGVVGFAFVPFAGGHRVHSDRHSCAALGLLECVRSTPRYHRVRSCTFDPSFPCALGLVVVRSGRRVVGPVHPSWSGGSRLV